MKKRNEIDFNVFLKNFKDQVSKKGFKNSIQKDYILKILFYSEEHLTAEQIAAKVKIDYNIDVGIATVYRTMKFLEELGVIEVLDIGDGVKRYEISLALHHDHLVCTSCGRIVEFTDEVIEEKQIKIAQDHKFDFKDHVMTIYGLCENCH